MNEEIHPLDRDDDALESPARREKQTLQRRLLKYCIWTGIACGASICIASAATANATYQSPAQRIGEVIQRVAGFGALAACVGMLFVFRLDSIRAAIENARQRAEQARIRKIEKDALAQSAKQQLSSFEGQNPMQPSGSNYSADLGLPAVLVGGSIYLVACWILAFALGPFPFLAFIPPVLQLMMLGLVITMTVFNTGVTRAFAIGFLATAAFSLLGIFGVFSMLFQQMYYSNYSRGNDFASMAIPIAVSTSVVCGWICATYVWVLQKVFTPTAMPLPTPIYPDVKNEI